MHTVGEGNAFSVLFDECGNSNSVEMVLDCTNARGASIGLCSWVLRNRTFHYTPMIEHLWDVMNLVSQFGDAQRQGMILSSIVI